MGKILCPSARAMGTSITSICKSDEKEKVLSPFARAMGKKLCPFYTSHPQNHGNHGNVTFAHLQSHGKMSCHVMSIFLHVTFAESWENETTERKFCD